MDLRHLSSSVAPACGSTSTRPLRHSPHQSATLSRSQTQIVCVAARERPTFEMDGKDEKSALSNATKPPVRERPNRAVSQARLFLQTIAAAKTPSDVALIWREARTPGPNNSLSNSVIALMRLSKLPGSSVEKELDAHLGLLEELLQSISIRIYSIPPQPLSDLCHAVAKAYAQLPEDMTPPTWWHDMAVDATISTLERSTTGGDAGDSKLGVVTLEAALTPPASASQALDAARLTRLVASLGKLDPGMDLGPNTVATLEAVIERLMQSSSTSFLTEHLAESVAELLDRMNYGGADDSAELEPEEMEAAIKAAEMEAVMKAAEREVVEKAAEMEAVMKAAEREAVDKAAEMQAEMKAADLEAEMKAAELEAEIKAAEMELEMKAAEMEAAEREAAAMEAAEMKAVEEELVEEIPTAEDIPTASTHAPPPASVSTSVPETTIPSKDGQAPNASEAVSDAEPTSSSHAQATPTAAEDEDEESEVLAEATASVAADAAVSIDSSTPATDSNRYPVEEASEIYVTSKKVRRSFPIWEDIIVSSDSDAEGDDQPGAASTDTSVTLEPYQEHFIMSQLQSLTAQRKTPSAEQLEGCCSAVKQYWEDMHPEDVANSIILLSQLNAGAPLGLPLLGPAAVKPGSSKGKGKGKKQQAPKADADSEALAAEEIDSRYYRMLNKIVPTLAGLGHARRCQLAVALSPPSTKPADTQEPALPPQRLPPATFTLAYCAAAESWMKDVSLDSMEKVLPEAVDTAMSELISILTFVAQASARGQVLLHQSFFDSCCKAVFTLTAQHINTVDQLQQPMSVSGSMERLLTLHELLVEGMGAAPSKAWASSLSDVLLPYLSANSRKMRFGMNPALVSRSLRLMGALRQRPHPNVLHSLLRGLQEESLVVAAPPQQLVQIFWSCAEFQLVPTLAALAAMLPALADGFVHLDAKSLALLCRSMSQLGVRPSAEWQLKLQDRVNECMGEADVESLSLICQGLLSFGMKPRDKWIAALLEETAFKMDQADAQSLVRLAHFVATCELKTFPTEWINALQLRSIQVVDTFEPADMLAMLLRSLAKMHWVPTPEWMVQVLAACSISAPDMSLASCAVVLNALPELGVLKMVEAGSVDPAFFNRLLDRMVRASVQHSDAASSTEIRWLLNSFVLYEEVPFEPNVNAMKRLTKQMKAKEKVEMETEAAEMAAIPSEEAQRYISSQLKFTKKPLVASLGDYVSRDWLKSCLSS
eukprot:gene27602-7239_t